MMRLGLVGGLLGVLLGCDAQGPQSEPSERSSSPEAESAAEGTAESSKTESSKAESPKIGSAEPTVAEAERLARAEVEAEAAKARQRAEDELLSKKDPEIESPREGTGGAASPTEPAPMSRPEPEPVALAAPPFAYTLVREAPLTQGPQPVLAKLSAKRNAITDVDAWLLTHGLSLPMWEGSGPGPGGRPRPDYVTATYRGQPLHETILSGESTIALHSSAGGERARAVVRDRVGDTRGAFDFDAYVHTPRDRPEDLMFVDQQLYWAQTEGGVLFACTYHRTYAASSGGLNAFVTALEISSGELLWQSEPLVCNSRNFLLRDGWIITGYGFTAERDFLYVLDARTGKAVAKTKVASGPEIILEKSGELYVRTYDRDYVFALR